MSDGSPVKTVTASSRGVPRVQRFAMRGYPDSVSELCPSGAVPKSVPT
ncbi:Uncharacterised protein [Mycobacteroides abscessus subsp. abscessus]|nr:Uncharacterised protein [Mycobacteroides abscessus subsp. abscessus]